MLSDRLCAAALFCCSVLVAVPAKAASRQDDPGRPEAHFEVISRDAGQMGTPRWSLSDGVDAEHSGEATLQPTRVSVYLSGISDPIAPAAHPNGVSLSPYPARSNSAVPLPTGLSLFGSGLLTLGLIGLFFNAPRRASLERGGQTDIGDALDPIQAVLPKRFRIEVRSERGVQVRHAVSARVTIDLIADLLNDGWEMVRICDRNGSSIDYEDVIRIGNSERLQLNDARRRGDHA